MCGIAGIWSLTPHDANIASRVREMASALAHRGPDAEGVWADDTGTLALGHRRLAIFDLSDAGHQPMHSANGELVLVFNGEIYNFAALRTELVERGVQLRSQTDTEVLLELIARDGVKATLPRLEGMFAFALWDRPQRRLTLARDAFGKKPLLYECNRDGVRFGSGLGAFIADRAAEAPRLDEAAAFLMLSFGAVPEPRTILDGVSKLPPGHVLDISRQEDGLLSQRLWQWTDPVTAPMAPPENPLEAFEEVFTSAVSLRLAADVPVGAFLSGGIDSSLVAAQAQSLMAERLKTFTVGFDVAGYDESHHAAAVAKHLDTEHHVLRLSAQDMEESCLAAAAWFDEPFADASAIPTRILSAFAREHVTVALTGDGGDETFLGYPLHRKNTSIVSVLAGVPPALRRGAAAALRLIPERRAAWWSRALGHAGPADYYLSQRMSGFVPEPELLGPITKRLPALEQRRSDAEWLGDCDLRTYLVDDMLTKVDRASMSVGLEARNPLLDQRVVALARATPLNRKIGGGKGKLLLRESLAHRFPEALFRRRKSGFRAPIGFWLNRPRLREWSGEHADAFDARFGWRTPAGLDARAIWQANQDAPEQHGRTLWRICQLMDWSKRYGV